MIDFKSLFAKKKEQGGAAPGAPAKGKESGAATLKDSKLGKSLQNLSQFDLKALFSGKKQFVGLDIGSSSLKLVEILGEKGSYTMNRFLMAPLEKGVIVDGVVAEVDTLAEAIKALFKNSGCQKKEIVASLSGHNVIIKKAPFPQMEEKELQETIRDEASKYLPFDNMDDVNFDFQVLGPSANNPHLNDVIIVATKKEMMDGYVEAVELAGLSLAIMHVDSFAMETM
ncbi:MAG TPA: pilus assembly protein PilM, partial [Syntrophales bacterium]|nr:pilus assembly protein PilM [Syntrophales bacterium]